MTAYEIAIAMYERTLQIFARYAGQPYEAMAVALPEDIAHKAEMLALPGERAQASLSEGDPASSAPPILVSIMGHLHAQEFTRFYKPQVIGSTAIMPDETRPVNLQAGYATLWQQFRADPQWLITKQQEPQVQEANLHALLQRYTWAMPAPLLVTDSDRVTDISFYDYARISAALAVCLQPTNDNPTNTAILIGGDISGVQEWLYTFGSAGAAKSLRGRSFYLQLLSEVIALYVLDYFKLPQANLLYAGGGNFYILAPTTAATKIDCLRQEISQKLLTMHEGALYVAIAHADVTSDHLLGENEKSIGSAWGDVSIKLSRQKAQRFSELDDAKMALVIGTALAGTGMPENSCLVCKRALTPAEGKRTQEREGKCDQCDSFEQLGQQLPHSDLLVINYIKSEESKVVRNWEEGLRQFGFDVWLVNNRHKSEVSWVNPNATMVRVFYWKEQSTSSDFYNSSVAQKLVRTFRPLAQCTPEIHVNEHYAEIADFSDMAQAADGIRRWGVLRMDVDNLGAIFRKGIPANNLCRVVGLSGLLRLFFEGRVSELARQINEAAKRPCLYLMYAGGDDLFVVGSWSHLPKLAHVIRTEFGKFACDNPQLTISGGVTIAPDEKYPLYQAAREAGQAEDMAKDLPDKDGFAFLGQAMKWEMYVQVDSRAQEIQKWVTEKLPRSFLMQLRNIDAEWRVWKRRERLAEWLEKTKPELPGRPKYRHNNEDLYLGPWQWHLVYTLSRMADRAKDSNLKELTAKIIGGEIKTIGLSARWAELLTRKEADNV